MPLKPLLLATTLLFQLQPPTSRFAYLTGTIGKAPVTVLLHQYGPTVVGHYYYPKTQLPIDFRGEVRGDSVIFSGYGPSLDETFKAVWKENIVSGVWVNNNGKSTSQPLQLTTDAVRSGWFQYVYVTGSQHLLPGKKDENNPKADYTEGMIWPTEQVPAPIRPVLENAIRQATKLGKAPAPGAVMLQRKNAFLKNYAKENAKVTPKEARETVGAYTASQDAQLTLAYLSESLAVLSQFTYEFSGGAHGNYGTRYLTLDLKTGKRLTLADVLSPAARKKLPALLEKAFRKQYGLKPGESLQSGGLFENKITPGENFYLTPTALVFSYAPYEIGPYAMGEITLVVPRGEVNE